MREVVLPNGRIRRYRTKEEIAEIVGRFRLSELSASRFAAENGLNLAVLRRWLKGGGAGGAGAAGVGSQGPIFQEVPLIGDSSSGWSAELIAPSGWVVRLSGSVSPRLLADLCQAVSR